MTEQQEREAMQQKNERNARVAARYDELMREGKHGHYETMFCVVREEIERDRAARSQQQGWRPIESAPKDGTWVVGAEWQREEGCPNHELFTGNTRYKQGAWRYRSGVVWEPTHWQPLPPAPSTTANRERE